MKDTRVDQYILDAPEYSKPILAHFRMLVHQACPDIQENIKWGFPSFEFEGLVCGMTAHMKYCSFSIWNIDLMEDPEGVLTQVGKSGMGTLGKIKEISQLPGDKIVMNFILQGVELNKQGIKREKKPSQTEAPSLDGFQDFEKVLNENTTVLKTYTEFSPSNKKEYLEWFSEAKTEKTRENRIAQAIEWISEGKPRNWKYMKKYRK